MPQAELFTRLMVNILLSVCANSDSKNFEWKFWR